MTSHTAITQRSLSKLEKRENIVKEELRGSLSSGVFYITHWFIGSSKYFERITFSVNSST